MKKNLVLACVCCILLTGCNKGTNYPGENGNPPVNKVKTDIVVGQASDVVSPDPHDQNDSNSNRAIRMIYDSLLYTDINGAQQPALAERWEMVEPTKVIFHLRRNVKFHNGDEFTGEDVLFSLQRQMESPKVKSFVEYISSVNLIDDYTVEIVTSQPYAPLLYNLSLPQSSIISKKHYLTLKDQGKTYLNDPVGTGPMKFKSWSPNDRFVVERYNEYWGKQATATTVELRVIPESSSRTIALETGEIDILESVPPVDVAKVEDNANLVTIKQPSTSVTYASYNMTKAPFDNKLVRQALSHAVNKEAIVDVVCEGYAEVLNTVYPSAINVHDSGLNLYPYDVEKAKALLTEAGFPNGFKIEMATSGDERNRIAQLLQSDFSKIGVTLDIMLLDWGAYLDYIGRKDHQMYIIGWSSGFEPDSNTTPLFHSTSGGPTGNRAWYANPDVDALIEQGKSTLAWAEREGIYKEIQHKIMEDAVWIPLFAKDSIIAMQKGTEGFEVSPIDAHIYVYTNIVRE